MRGRKNGNILDFLIGEASGSQHKFRMSPLFSLFCPQLAAGEPHWSF